jgi:hypothetical protein
LQSALHRRCVEQQHIDPIIIIIIIIIIIKHTHTSRYLIEEPLGLEM